VEITYSKTKEVMAVACNFKVPVPEFPLAYVMIHTHYMHIVLVQLFVWIRGIIA
jgi:hypothetical protein